MKTVTRYMFMVLTLLLCMLSACRDKTATDPAAGAPPPPTVAVASATRGALAISSELPGRIEASRIAQVRARTPGIVLQRVFREGGDVKAGEVLFRIDPASFQASYNSAQAAVLKADANLAQADLKARRYQQLAGAGAVSTQEYDDAVTAQKQANADLATARAARQNAGLTLGYATVTAPIAGRIGRALVTEGALVGQGEATPMATIQQLDPIYVTITQSSTELLRLQRALEAGKLKSAGAGQARVTLVTEDGQTYPHDGKLLFADISVDESSGSVSMRAAFPNPQRVLLPGMYVRARLEQAVDETAITVPQQAVLRNPEGASVMLVGTDNKVLVQPVTATTAQGDRWVIGSGLKGGEKVIVEGFQKVRPGAPVTPVAWAGPPAGKPSATP
ncbi:efflux RND transporter periplasmic adaptor subunit [Janthinobacterium agaricidamnosum]|uniref:Acriflavine resistance protein A n=1 Tax=Janthinobacterium agaricidamnosum NBRC 102515 = DSM 9628 TaxID=1349767 RepID=W0UZF0_9BURK|nr:efflux RND transporter periplasmic adaptor subunit [Janthinobacterium agaricidamnosum]CDG81934.1 acriflavine resistance protein A [Janthinobacterium agaricidamnosum NBRC 102515 = DSM 9628]